MKSFNIERFIRFLIGLAIVLLILFVLYRFFVLILYALIALVFSYILDPFVNRLQAVGLNRTLAISLVLSTLVLLLVWFSSTILPAIAGQVIMLGQQLNIDAVLAVSAEIEEQILQRVPFLPEGFLRDNIPGAVEVLFQTDDISRTINNILGIFANIFWAFIYRRSLCNVFHSEGRSPASPEYP